MKYIPHPYQKEDIEFLLTGKIGGLFEDMGLGKSSVVLSVIDQARFDYFDTHKVIIVAPKNVILNQWPMEILKWDMSKDTPFTILHGNKKDDRLLFPVPIFLINYDGLPWLLRKYRNRNLRKHLPAFDMLVIDESTFIKNDQTQRHRILKMLFGDIKRKIILTGTPTPKGLIDLYGQISMLDDRVLGTSLTSYRNNYFLSIDNGTGVRKYMPRRGSRDLITKRIAHLVKIRKAKDHLDKKELRINKIYCELPKKQRKEYDELEKEFFLELDSGDSVEVFNAASLTNKLRQYVQGFVYLPGKVPQAVNTVKFKVLKEILESVNGQPVLCAIQFLAEVDLLRKYLGYEIPAINSKTSSRLTSEHIVNWNKGKIPLLLAHPQSIGHGVNLQDGGHINVWLGLPWAMDHHQQFDGRLDRQGQKHRVISHHILIKDTIDHAVEMSIENKTDEQNKIMAALQHYREERGL